MTETTHEDPSANWHVGARSSSNAAILCDNPLVCSETIEDLANIGCEQVHSLSLKQTSDKTFSTGDLIFAHFSRCTEPALSAIEALDATAAKAGKEFVLSISATDLDVAFAAASRSDPHILVAASRAERLVALGAALTETYSSRVRELSPDDRKTLIRLSEQVSAIAKRLDGVTGLEANSGQATSAFSFTGSSSAQPTRGSPTERLVRKVKPALPDPRLVRKIIQQRQLRARFFDGDLFGDPAWDMLLDLTAARVEHVRVSVTSLCIASGVPPTTALRWISQMTDAGLLERLEDETDRRRAFMQLTEKAADAMAYYFDALGRTDLPLG